ncbi:MAG TPA: HAMP domain-containing protein, partial [Chromatiales bacterium]|nr:HAMP domain-containing protein [Chromatiales bacterium]HEX22239.1 HAMP domain-containing protein [Chromatiales bacterium]
MIFNRHSLRFNVAFSIFAMGALSIVLAVLATEIYRQFAIDSQRAAIEQVIGLQVDEVLDDMGRVVHIMGQSLQEDAGFRREFQARDVIALQRRLASQFHQYFVTAGILRPRYMAVYDLDFNLVTGAMAEGLDRPATCSGLRRRAVSRQGASRLKSITELCLQAGRPHFSVLMPVGGLRLSGYLEVVVDPVFSLQTLEGDLGMPLRIAYVDGSAAYTSGLWPADAQRRGAVASFALVTAAGEEALTVSLAQDISAFESRLEMTRNSLIIAVALLGLLLAGLMLYALNQHALVPLQRLGEQLRNIRRDKQQLGQKVVEEGNAEVRLLAHGFNEMTDELRSLYDMLLARQDELQSEIHEREQAQQALQSHKNQLEELVHQRTLDLAQARDAALEASHSKSQFLANMSHELRTPLNAVIGYSELLMDNARQRGEDRLAEDLRRVHTAGQHLLSLINDVLDLSKIEAGKMQLFEEWFSISDLINDVADTIHPLVGKNGNRLNVRCADNVTIMYADVTKLRQILFNLLSNACKFTHNGEIEVSVWCETNRGRMDVAGQVFFSVSDTGIGMASGQLEKIFEAFSQADLSTTRKYGGTGLGLAIAQHFCHLMEGGIHVVSEQTNGSTFTVMLPLRTPHEDHLFAGDDEAPRSGVAALGQRLAGKHDGIEHERRKHVSRILVIDDDPAILHIMSHFL